MVKSISNVSLSDFRRYLEYKGLNLIRTTGGHEVWSSKDLLRPVVIQAHIDPVPEFVIRNNLRTIGSTWNELETFLISNKPDDSVKASQEQYLDKSFKSNKNNYT